MAKDIMITQEIYLKRTDAEGKSHIRSHWVWDKDRFLASQRKDAEAEAKKDGSKPVLIEQVSRADYLEQISRGRRG